MYVSLSFIALRYADVVATVLTHVLSSLYFEIQQNRGVKGLFIGVRASLLNAILPFGNWYLLGVPFLVKTRRMVSRSFMFSL
jgi:hypothetical protein